jgi:hypothetical protein
MRIFSFDRGVLVVLAFIGCLSVAVPAQDSEEPPPSLGELGRQSRAQHATAPDAKSNKAQERVDEMQAEQEASDNAPVGYKNYDAGDYRLFVPFPYSLEGRDNGGAVLLGSQVGVTNTEVLAGTPVPIPPYVNEAGLPNFVRQIASRYSTSSYCSAVKRGSRNAFRCSMNNGQLLGRQITGSMEFIVASNRLIPVMCAGPDEMRNCTYNSYGYQTCGKRYPTWEESQRVKNAIQTQYRDQLKSAQACDKIIYPSIQLKEDIVVHAASIPEGKAHLVATAAGIPAQNSAPVIAGPQSASLADLARETRQAPHGTAQAKFDNGEGKSAAPAGFQPFGMQFCMNPQQCSGASVIIPEKTEVVSRTNGQHIFKTALDGEFLLLYAGPADVNAPYRSLTDADFIRMRDLANSNGWSHEKADAVSTQDLTIQGKPAQMTRFRYLRDQKRWWIGERVLIGTRGAQFLVGCTAPEEHFADAEVLCTTLVNSLQLP